jgi:hypothetical protein
MVLACRDRVDMTGYRMNDGGKPTRRSFVRQAFIGENSVLKQRGGAPFCDVT